MQRRRDREERPREDDTVRTTLRNASERCRKISRQCASADGKGLRLPTPGTIDRVDTRKLKKIDPPARADDEQEDAVTRLIRLVLGRERSR